MPYTLTPADIIDLRSSVRWNPSVSPIGLAFICHARSDRAVQGADDDVYSIHTQGQLRATSKRIEVLAECLRQETARPGFVVAILNPHEDCHVASLDPAEAAALRSRQAFEAKASREYAHAEELRLAAAKRSTPKPKPSPIDIRSLSADDIFDD